MDLREKNGLYKAQYQAVKSDPEGGQIVADLEDEIYDLKQTIEGLEATILNLERDIEEKDEQMRLAIDSFSEIEDQARRCQKAYGK